MDNRQNDAAADPRVSMAAERTLLAWIRTGLAMMGFGFVVARFGMFLRELAAQHAAAPAHGSAISLWLGAMLVALGVAVNVVAGLHHRHYLIRLGHEEQPQPLTGTFAVLVAFALAMIGAAMAVYLLATGNR